MMANQYLNPKKNQNPIIIWKDNGEKPKNPISGLMLKSNDSPRKPTALSKPVQKQPGY
jgi:hypothetical protein